MRILGVLRPLEAPVLDFGVVHGAHPINMMFKRGFVPIRPLATNLNDGEIIFTYLVRSRRHGDRAPRRREPPHHHSRTAERPKVYQRVGAYAIVLSGRGLLGTVNSRRSGGAGCWALPGGGVDDGESPAAAVRREVFEETGQEVALERVLGLDSDHWIGHSLEGHLEDFHALRILYAATCEAPSDPVVHDRGGSTQRASWVAIERWPKLRWTNASRLLLNRYLRDVVQTQSLK